MSNNFTSSSFHFDNEGITTRAFEGGRDNRDNTLVTFYSDGLFLTLSLNEINLRQIHNTLDNYIQTLDEARALAQFDSARDNDEAWTLA
jgi:hypothetical protein